MFYPELSAVQRSTDLIEEFKGLNRRIRCADNEFFDMKNLSADNYPVLSTRKERAVKLTFGKPNGIIYKKGLTYVDGTQLYVNETAVELPDISLSDSKKQLVSMGAYLLIFPDKVYVNVETVGTNNLDCGYIDNTAEINAKTAPIAFTMCSLDTDTNYQTSDPNGANYVLVSPTAPSTSGLSDGYMWLDTSNGVYMKQWNSSLQSWTVVSSVYTRLSATGIGKGFAEGDAVKIENLCYLYEDSDNRIFIGEAFIRGEEPEANSDTYVDLYDINGILINSASYSVLADSSVIGSKYFVVNGHTYVYQPSRDGQTPPVPLFKRTKATQNTALYDSIDALNTTMLIQKAADDYIVITGILPNVYVQHYGKVKLSRKMPVMDFVIENNNRLWGCRYGLNADRETVNEIYASKQGDFKNWSCYAGISTDSYAVTVGSDGEFTGAVSYGNYPLFFKENYIHRISGVIPSQFSVVTTKCRGVQKGSERSIAILNEALFYKSASDICIYQGALPTSISAKIGDIPYKNAVAGAVNNKYYISMQDSTGENTLFVYDSSTGIWSKEDNIPIQQFCTAGTQLYFISGNDLISPTGDGETKESEFDWFAQSGIMGYSIVNNKYVGKLNIRLQSAERISVYIQYDSGTWELLTSVQCHGTRLYSIPIKPHRCDHFAIRIEGTGECRIFGISKTIEQGSDVNV